jgi:hypothetical protein
MGNKKVIYTCITGGYDKLKEPTTISEGWDYICFYDIMPEHSINTKWKLIATKRGNAVRTQRHCKIFNTKILKNYDLSVWVDGSILVNVDLNLFVDYFHKGSLTTMVHPTRYCVYEEAKACLYFKKDSEKVIDEQMERYFQEGYPAKNGMVQTGVIIRTHTREVKDFCFEWWQELQRGSIRDQLSFNYVLFHNPIPAHFISSKILQNEFILQSHLKK